MKFLQKLTLEGNLIKKEFSLAGKPLTRVFFSVIFALYFGLTLYRFLFPANALITSIIIGLGLVSLLYSLIVIRSSHVLIFLYAILLALSHVISSLAVFRTERIEHVILFILSNTGIAVLLLKGTLYNWAATLVFYTLAVPCIILILIGVNVDDHLTVVSHNGISMLIIVACITFYVVNYLNGKVLVLTPAFLTLVICIWGSGRSGILSGFILFLGLALLKFRIGLKWAFFLFVGIGVFFYLYIETILFYALEIPFFTNAAGLYLSKTASGDPDVRVELWMNYLHNLDFYRVVFGANVYKDPWPDGRELAYNYHNTYIHLHFQTGLMGIMTIFLLITALGKFLFTNQIFFVLCFALCLRWFTDTGLFFESWDYLPFFFIFTILCGKRPKDSLSNL